MNFLFPLPAAHFADLDPISIPTLAEQLETVRTELAEFEVWLGAPPAEATEANIQEKISLWDSCRQWLLAYQKNLYDKQREVAALDEELAEVRGMLRTLEGQKHRYHDDSAMGGATRGHRPMSHDEMAAADAHWDELDRRENRIHRRLAELGAPIPTADDEAPPPQTSHIQRALDQEWASANFAGPGCPFCDSIFGGCSCWARRAEAHTAEERRQMREDRAAIARAIAEGKCYCDKLSQNSDYQEECDICRREEELRCKGCGQLQCRPGCCGDCGNCSRCCGSACKRCGDWESNCHCWDDREDDRSSCGCGACEEHDGREESCW
jgi:hypothetical protein